MGKKILPFLITRLIDLMRRTGFLPSNRVETLPLNVTPRSILVVANTALGDVLLCTPAIQSLRRSFPDAQITVLMHHSYLPLFQSCDFIDTFVPYYGGYRHFLSTVRALRKTRPDIALILHGNGPQDIQLCALSGASYIFKHPNRSPLQHLLSATLPRKQHHTIETKLDLVRAIGGRQLITTMATAPLRDTDLTRKFSRYSGAVAFQLGAADRYKMWPVERFAELARRLLDADPTRQILLTGIAAERPLAEKLQTLCPDERIHNLCGETDIRELPYLLRQCALLVTNDTGTMHLAIALRVPTLALFAPTPAKRLGAYQDPHLHRSIQKDGAFIQKLPKKERDDRAMRLIGVDEVFREAQAMLATDSTRNNLSTAVSNA